nr:sialic acid-binding Ig-like lectin 12 [Pogona vitticeps]
MHDSITWREAAASDDRAAEKLKFQENRRRHEKMSHSLEVFALRLVMTCLLWKEVRGQSDAYILDAPNVVTVQEGLCVIIPCTFAYPASPESSPSELYGYWYATGSRSYRDPSVATNDEKKEVADYTRHRFHLSEGLEQGDCSLIITEARKGDERPYFFRMEKGRIKYSYVMTQPSLRVTKAVDQEKHAVLSLCPSTAIPLFLSLLLIKVLFCFLFFFLTFWHFNGRTALLHKRIAKGRQLDLLHLFCPGLRLCSWETMQGEKSCQLESPSLKAGDFVSSPAKVTALVFLLLCKGVLTQRMNYTITVPKTVHVPRGFCVHVPCKFTTPERYKASAEPMYGYWFRIMRRRYYLIWTNLWVLGYLMATNDGRQKAQETHMKLTGDPALGDCSFSIIDAGLDDWGWYYFRIDKGEQYRYAFLSTRHDGHIHPHIVLTDLPTPTIQRPPEIIWGQPATFICEVPNVCSDNRARLLWPVESNSFSKDPWSKEHSQWTWTYGVNVTFIPSLADEGKVLTCQLEYPAKGKLLQDSTRLDLGYKPEPINAFQNTKCSLKGHVLVCVCSFHSWPPPQILWNVDGKNLTENSTSEPLQVISWTKGNEVYSTLNWTGGHVQDNNHSITCIGANNFGHRIIDMFPKLSKKTKSPFHLSLAMISGIIVGSLLALTGTGILLRFFMGE